MSADHGNAKTRGVVQEFGLWVRAYPELLGAEIFEDCGEASDVVLVGVGGYYDVELGDTSGPEVGGDYVFAGVQG
jgi:hypothetical protein